MSRTVRSMRWRTMSACSLLSASTWIAPCCARTEVKCRKGSKVSRDRSPLMVRPFVSSPVHRSRRDQESGGHAEPEIFVESRLHVPFEQRGGRRPEGADLAAILAAGAQRGVGERV